ncbi:uncharacterized protein LOC141648597 [Silene latifolia]|uniref:uncharacterized protein LOC141648597 n=1 Tax=Silene latifolia TaxID=37657 RepID=UPI003D78A22F
MAAEIQERLSFQAVLSEALADFESALKLDQNNKDVCPKLHYVVDCLTLKPNDKRVAYQFDPLATQKKASLNAMLAIAYIEDKSVKRWILHFISPPLRENLQYAASAKNLWSEIVERYGQLNVLELYELKKDLINAKQENQPLIDYYSRMKNLWESIDQMDPVPVCVCGAMSACTCQLLKKILDRETHSKLIQLLMGLNSSYEQVQTTVLSMDPLPSINRTLGLLQKIEKQKVLNDSANEASVATASYASKKRPSNTSFQGQAFKKSKDSDAAVDVCDHCNKPGHVIADCHRLKTCTFCNIKGHIVERCYKYRAFLAKKGKAKVADCVPTANNVVTATHDQDEEYIDVSPLETIVPFNQPIHYPGMPANVSSDMVQGIINSVMQQVSKAYSDSSPLSSSVNFAGPFK